MGIWLVLINGMNMRWIFSKQGAVFDAGFQTGPGTSPPISMLHTVSKIDTDWLGSSSKFLYI